MAARLVAVSEPLHGSTWALGEELSIGRSNLNQIQIEDRYLSRQQCAIRQGDGRFRVEDSASSNGSFANGLPVTCRVLAHGDRIRAGHSVFVLFSDDASREEEKASSAQ